MTTSNHVFAGVALAALIALPAAAATITSEQIEAGYDFREMVAVGDGKTFKVQVIADPRSATASDATASLVSSLQRIGLPGARTTFVAGEAGRKGGGPDYRLVLAVSPARSVSAHALCANPSRVVHAPQPAGRLTLGAAWCRDDQVLSQAVVAIAASTIADPAVERGLSELLPVLFPQRAPGDDRGRPFFR